NAKTLRAIYSDFSLLEKYAGDDIVLHAAGSRDIMTGDYVGKQAVLAKELELFARSGGTLALVVDHIVANEHFGVMIGRFTANRDGKPFEGEVCGLWRFRDGLVVEHWENCADWAAAERYFVDDFFAEPADKPADAEQVTG